VLPTQLKKVRVREFLTIIACIVPIMPLGYLLYAKLRAYEGVLKLIMGVVIVYVSAYAIYWRMIRKQEKETSRAGMYAALGVGAIVQAMFSTGGALINVYSISKIKDKSEFRATMVAVWITTNTISTIYRVFVLHMYTQTICMSILYALPLIVVAFLIGNRLHKMVPNGKFADFVYIIQLVSGPQLLSLRDLRGASASGHVSDLAAIAQFRNLWQQHRADDIICPISDE
jgi:hypothetical protein